MIYVLYALVMLAPLLAGGGVSAWLGWQLGKRVLEEEADLPQWLEAVAPLKGRWLRLFFTTPVILFAMLVTFLVIAIPLYYLAGLVLFLCYYVPLLGCLLMGLLGMLAIAALITGSKAKRAGTVSGERA